MRIAIIDDIAAEREILHERVNVQLARISLRADIFEYKSGHDFLSAAEEERFEMAFLDIYMENENGMDTAKELRLFDSDCLLVFTTTSRDHALDGFRVRAMHYLVKPYTDEELTGLFDEALERLPRPDQYIEVTPVAGNTVWLQLGEILYAEHFRHQIHIHQADGQTTVTRQTFREFAQQLPKERFFQCSRGTIVNLEYAKDFNGTAFLLKNGEKLPVSRDLAKDARLAFGDYLFQRRPGL